MCNAFRHLKGLHWTKVIFLLIKLYICRRGDVNVGYKYFPSGNVEYVGTVNFKFYNLTFLAYDVFRHTTQPVSFGFPMLFFLLLLFLNISHCDNRRSAKKGDMLKVLGCNVSVDDLEFSAISIHFCLSK